MIENEKIDAVFRFIASYKDGVTDNLLAGLYLSEIDYEKILLEFIDDGAVIQRADKYVLTSYGREINRSGGWTKYHNDILTDKKLQRDNLDAAIKTNKSVRINMWITLAVSVVIGIATVVQAYTAYTDRQDRLEKMVRQFPNPHPTHRCFPYAPYKCRDRVLIREKTDTKHEKPTLTTSP